MRSLIFNCPTSINPMINSIGARKLTKKVELSTSSFQLSGHRNFGVRVSKFSGKTCYSSFPSESNGGQDEQSTVQGLWVPSDWMEASRALEESEWLRVTLQKWLDDEYCPEPTNIEISRVAAKSFYKSLMEKRVDLGDILLKMAVELESISYQESFHGAFSSANAAVDLIVQRILE
ncbi:hypothetical protein STAS_09104 [Striga asiatica]|uniref:Uncharacterized protein n=1 Tax=Striga asiatica TaxID=4170 RepID=A0A5A7PJN5_STRAF|nr:hypothetical protein STAS_09104 [Striga asiatica]